MQPGEAELTQRVKQDDPTRVHPGSASQCVIRLVGALLVEINDEMIAAASVTELTAHNVELALPAAPRTCPTSFRGTHEVIYTTRRDAIGRDASAGAAACRRPAPSPQVLVA
jgi:hypothetical protein